MNRVKTYITGMGAVTSLGIGVEPTFAALEAGRTAVTRKPEWEQYKGLQTFLGASVPAYDISKLPRQTRRAMSRMSEMAALATLEALGQADLRVDDPAVAPRVLLCMGSTTGSPDTMETYFRKLFEKNGPEGQMSTTFFKVMNHSVAANVAAALGFKGPALAPSSACATSAHALILGWELIQAGLYDIVIAGGADELHYTSAAVFDIVQAASRGYNTRPEESPRPFDSQRDGLVVSEGASAIVLESAASMARRKVRPLAEMLGGAYLCDGTHMSQSSAETMVATMRAAFDRAGISPSEVGYVNAHATGTVQGDQQECEAIGKAVGNQVPVSSLKGHLGHSLAACGGIEVAACIKMLEKRVLIPTRNLQSVAPDCSQVLHLREKKESSLSIAVSNNFAFGGINTSLVLSRV